MIIAMLLAHLIGDYVLQWDRLAAWKSREVKGALVHGLIVLIVTVLLALPFDVAFVPYALFIGLTHMAVDALQPWLGRRVPLTGPGLFGLGRLVLDQAVHLSLIALALVWGGYVTWPTLGADMLTAFDDLIEKELSQLVIDEYLPVPNEVTFYCTGWTGTLCVRFN